MYARVDAAGDEQFELTMGQYAHNADLELGTETTSGTSPLVNMPYTQSFVQRLDYYVRLVGFTSLDNWLSTKRLRIDSYSKDVFSTRGSVAVGEIGGYGDAGASAPGLTLGNLTQGGAIVSPADMDLTTCDGSPILGRVTVKAATDWTVTATLKLWDGTTKNVVRIVAGSAPVGTTYIFGSQAIGGATASGQKTVAVAATAQFKVGQKVLLTQWSGSAPDEVWVSQEVAVIATINADTSLVMVENLLHTYTTAGFVYPIYKGVTVASGTGGTASDRLYFYPATDRRLKL
jgi:hypothetical protein